MSAKDREREVTARIKKQSGKLAASTCKEGKLSQCSIGARPSSARLRTFRPLFVAVAVAPVSKGSIPRSNIYANRLCRRPTQEILAFDSYECNLTLIIVDQKLSYITVLKALCIWYNFNNER